MNGAVVATRGASRPARRRHIAFEQLDHIVFGKRLFGFLRVRERKSEISGNEQRGGNHFDSQECPNADGVTIA